MELVATFGISLATSAVETSIEDRRGPSEGRRLIGTRHFRPLLKQIFIHFSTLLSLLSYLVLLILSWECYYASSNLRGVLEYEIHIKSLLQVVDLVRDWLMVSEWLGIG